MSQICNHGIDVAQQFCSKCEKDKDKELLYKLQEKVTLLEMQMSQLLSVLEDKNKTLKHAAAKFMVQSKYPDALFEVLSGTVWVGVGTGSFRLGTGATEADAWIAAYNNLNKEKHDPG